MIRIDEVRLKSLLDDWRRDRLLGLPMSNRLGSILLELVEISLKQSKYRGYTDDWKEDFRSNAFVRLIKNCWCFNPHRIDYYGKPVKPSSFLFVIIQHAVGEEIERHKKEEEKKIIVLDNQDSIDENREQESINQKLDSTIGAYLRAHPTLEASFLLALMREWHASLQATKVAPALRQRQVMKRFGLTKSRIQQALTDFQVQLREWTENQAF